LISRIQRLIERLTKRGQEIFDRLDKRSGGRLGLAVATMQAYGRHRGGLSAAAMAYYSLFAMFPLLLFLVVVLSTVLQSPQAEQELFDFISGQIPVSIDLIHTLVDQALMHRGAVGLIAGVSLLWSASGLFVNMEAAIQRAWEVAGARPFWQGRLVGLAMVLLLTIALILSLLSASIVGLVRMEVVALIPFQFLQRAIAELLPMIIVVPVFYALYKVVPYTKVHRNDALAGAAFASVGWLGIKLLFTYYLSANPARYSALYGSLGALIALLVWIYMTAEVLLIGAELSAELHRRRAAKANMDAPLLDTPS
jgi:membrane protein